MYLIALTFAAWASLINGIALSIHEDRIARPWWFLLGFLPGVASMFPVVWSILDLGNGMDMPWFPVALSLAGALLGIGVTMYGYVVRVKSKKMTLIKSGLAFLTCLMFLVVAVAAGSHLAFMGRGGGFLAFDFVREQVKDVPCDAPVMLVAYDRETPSEYRCPTTFMLIQNSSSPFLPWPDFTTGTSMQLTTAISSLMDNAHKLDAGETHD